MSFTSFGFSEEILRGVHESGYTEPTKIQSLAIPIVLEGLDLVGCAQTGTGKTAAFVLPMLERLSATRGAKSPLPRALVLTPTRELAVQIEAAVRTYGKFLRQRSLVIYGGVGIEPQYRAMRRGADILIATPGRLLDLINRGAVDLSRIEILVLDEADRMFDMGFIDDVKKIVGRTPKERQTLLFSATMSKKILESAGSMQRNPRHVEVGSRSNPVESVDQHILAVRQDHKMELLLHILSSEDSESVIIFSRTKHGADRIASRLERVGIAATAIHSNRTQGQRLRALDGFKRGEYRVLVATDIAARGIDIDGITHVINYDTPNSPEDYIHRIGRTGRASASGKAFTFVARDEEQHLQKMEKFIGKRFQKKQYPGFAAPIMNDADRPRSSAPAPTQYRRGAASYGQSNGGGSRPTRSRGGYRG